MTQYDIRQTISDSYSETAVESGSGYAVAIGGYPGAGKTTAAKFATEALSDSADETVREVSIKESLVDYYTKTASISDDFPPTQRKQYLAALVECPIGFPEHHAVRKHSLSSAELAVVDGVLSRQGLVRLDKAFDAVSFIRIEVPALVRHARLQDREKEMLTAEELRTGDRIADKAGARTLKNRRITDYEIENIDISVAELGNVIRSSVRGLYTTHRQET